MGAFHVLLTWRAWAAASVALVVAWEVGRSLRARPLALGWLAGALAFPVVVGLVVLAGRALGLPPGPARAPVRDVRILAWGGVLAPFLEEGLYRGWLLPALAGRIGRLGALLFTSLCFALPHGGDWDLLATFLVGLGLGAVFLWKRSLGLCVGLHAGLNAVALLRGVP